MEFNFSTQPNGDLLITQVGGTLPRSIDDTDFQAWLTQQPPAVQSQAVLSPRQQLIRALRQLTLAQWQDGTTVSAAQKDKIAFFAMKSALSNEVI